VSDLLICVRVFQDVSDLLIFDSCVTVSGFVYTPQDMPALRSGSGIKMAD
jgi:hypothetical protein